MIMEKYIFMVNENVLPPKFEETIYVRASEGEIRQRMYAGGFLRFLSSCYDYSKNYPQGTKCNGQKILSLREFDKWRKEHYCC